MIFLKRLSLTIITLFFGGLIFKGIIENYKNEVDLKKSILDEYFTPTIKNYSECLEKQRKLSNLYLKDFASFKLFFIQTDKAVKNPDLKRNYDFTLATKAIFNSYTDTHREVKNLENELESCNEKTSFEIRDLSIVTGNYELYKKELYKKDNSIIDMENKNKIIIDKKIYKNFLDRTNEIFNGELSNKDYLKKNINSYRELNENLEKYYQNLHIITLRKYELNKIFFEKLRDSSAKNISSRFRQSFIDWILGTIRV